MNSAGVESECSDAWVRKRGFWKLVGWVGWCVHVACDDWILKVEGMGFGTVLGGGRVGRLGGSWSMCVLGHYSLVPKLNDRYRTGTNWTRKCRAMFKTSAPSIILSKKLPILGKQIVVGFRSCLFQAKISRIKYPILKTREYCVPYIKMHRTVDMRYFAALFRF